MKKLRSRVVSAFLRRCLEISVDKRNRNMAETAYRKPYHITVVFKKVTDQILHERRDLFMKAYGVHG